MGRSFKLLLAAVALLAVMCAGAAFAADPVEVELKMGARMITGDQGGGDPTPLPGDELRLWVTRRVGSFPYHTQILDAKGNDTNPKLILFATKPTADAAEGKWLTDRTISDISDLKGSGVIEGTSGISYEIYHSVITLSADVNAVSGDRTTIYVYGGKVLDPYPPTGPATEITSVQAYDDNRDLHDVTPFPQEPISLDGTTDHSGGVITYFNVVVLSSDADLLLEQIEADPMLDSKVTTGPTVIEKDARGNVSAVNKNQDKEHLPHLSVNLADGAVELVVISVDHGSQGNIIDNNYLAGLDATDARAYLRLGQSHVDEAEEKTVFTFKPSIDPSGTIKYLIGEPDMLYALIEYMKANPNAVFHIDFDDVNSKFGWDIPEYSVRLGFSQPSGGSSSGCAAGAAALVALAALAVIKRRAK